MADTQTIQFGDITFALWHDPTYIPDCAVAQLPKDDLEPELSHLLVRTCRPGDTVVDAGANIGYFTMLMSRLVGPSGFVHAFEPHPDTARRLDANIVLNKAPNVLIHEVALWDCLRDMSLYTCFEPGLASLRPYQGWTGSRTVRTQRLDAILLTPPRLIKLDIEGAELAALKGSEKLLPDVPFVAIEMARKTLALHGTTPEVLADYMLTFGKDLWMLDKQGNLPVLHPRGQQVPDGPMNRVCLFATEVDVMNAWETHDAG